MVDDSEIDLDEHDDLIDEVINEEWSQQAKWDIGSMRAAVEQVSKGRSRSKAADDYNFSDKRLGEIVNKIHDAIAAREARSGMTRDPVSEAAEDVVEYLEDLNEKFQIGLKDKFVNKVKRDVEMKKRLPHPGTLGDMLSHYDSGIGSDSGDIGFVVDDYAAWLNNYQEEPNGWRGQSGAGGVQVNQPRQQHGGSQAGGVPIGQPPGGQAYNGGYGGQQPGQPMQGQQGQQGQPMPQWAQRIQSQQEAVTETLEHVVQALQDDDGGQEQGQLVPVEIESEDGTTQTVHLPPNDPRLAELMGGGGDEDFLTQLQAAKDAGLIVTPDQLDQGGDEMAEAVQAGLESVAEVQKETNSRFAGAIREVTEAVKAQSESEELTPEKVDEIIEERLTKSEQERLHEEITALREEVRSQGEQSLVVSGGDGTPLMEDREVMKRHVDRQAERDQLQTVQHAGDQVVDKVIPEVRRGLRDIGFMLAQGAPPTGENAPGQSAPTQAIWTPPDEREEEEPAVQRLDPDDVAPAGGESDDVAELWESLTREEREEMGVAHES